MHWKEEARVSWYWKCLNSDLRRRDILYDILHKQSSWCPPSGFAKHLGNALTSTTFQIL